MSRRGVDYKKRPAAVDERFGSELVQKFMNVIMERGKKSVARRLVYEAMDALVAKADGNLADGLSLFEKIISMVRPEVEVKARRVGGGVYQVPTQVRSSRAVALAFRWIKGAAESRSDKTMGRRLSKEFLEILDGRGGALKKRTDVHRMADANRAFSHYAW